MKPIKISKINIKVKTKVSQKGKSKIIRSKRNTKRIKLPIIVNFKMKDGSFKRFKATKCIKKPKKISFKKIKKRYKK